MAENEVKNMAIEEVFRNPTVRQVIFQIMFPDLFYMENKIGEFQLKIMKDFPQTSTLNRQQVVFGDLPPNATLDEIVFSKKGQVGWANTTVGNKIWQFRNAKNDVELNVTSSSLDITSTSYKTYNLGTSPKFRDMIELIMVAFLQITGIPIIKRLGLRYVDDCPLPTMKNDEFSAYYNSAFPISRFDISKTKDMQFRITLEAQNCFIRYQEALTISGEKSKYTLDFDGFAIDVDATSYLATLDKLHVMISNEFQKTIKEPVFQYMRKEKE